MLYRTKILDEEGIQHALSYGRPGQKKIETWKRPSRTWTWEGESCALLDILFIDHENKHVTV